MKRLKLFGGRLGRFVRGSRAAAALEYAILAGVITVAIVAGAGVFSNSLQDAFNTIGDNISNTVKTVGK